MVRGSKKRQIILSRKKTIEKTILLTKVFANKSRARQCNISYVQASAAVRARRSLLTFSSLIEQHIFRMGICTGQTSNEFTVYSNT